MIDLHAHSTVSDGLLSPAELVMHAANSGVRVLALTDHDDISGLAEARVAAAEHDIALVNGVEISVTWKKRTLHIVGLKVNPEDAALKSGLASVRLGRIERARQMSLGLEKVGIHGAFEAASSFAENSILTRMHFARFLVEKQYAKDAKSVFKKYLVKGKPGYVSHQWASLAEAVSWIVASGGQAVIAHPGRYQMGSGKMHELLEEFKNLGGVGIEVVTGSHTPEQYPQYAQLAQK
ncbi:MAG: phosphatase, partial [Mehylophilales bacterium 35-46-6]